MVKGEGSAKRIGRDSAYYVNAEGELVPVPTMADVEEPVETEFYNTSHAPAGTPEGGQFDEGKDGPGRKRDPGQEDLGKKGTVSSPPPKKEKVGYGGLGRLVRSEDGGFVDRKTGVRYDSAGKVIGEIDHGKVAEAVVKEIPDPPGAEKAKRGLISRILRAIRIDRTDDVHSITEKVLDIFNKGAGPEEHPGETGSARRKREKIEKAQAKGMKEAELLAEYRRRTGKRGNRKYLERRGIRADGSVEPTVQIWSGHDALEAFYNQSHGEGGRFDEGPDGPGRVRDPGTEDLGVPGTVTDTVGPKGGGVKNPDSGTAPNPAYGPGSYKVKLPTMADLKKAPPSPKTVRDINKGLSGTGVGSYPDWTKYPGAPEDTSGDNWEKFITSPGGKQFLEDVAKFENPDPEKRKEYEAAKAKEK